MKSRRLLIIVIVLLVLIGIGTIVYFLLRPPEGTVEPSPGDPPFGTADSYPGGGGGEVPDVGEPQQEAGETLSARFVKITDGPVALGTNVRMVEETIVTGTGTSTQETTITDIEARFVERMSGNVYGYRADEQTLTRLTNQTLPGVQEVSWAPDGSRAFLRFLAEGSDEVETYALPVATSSGYFLESGLTEVVVAGTNLLTLLPNGSGSVGTLAGTDGGGALTLFMSPLAALRVYAAAGSFFAHTKASALLDGYGFLINGTSGSFERVLGPARGLTLLPSPSGESVLYGTVAGTTLQLGLLDIATRETVSLPVGTLPEKCVWSADEAYIYCAVPRAISGTLPDAWYQGAATFSDRLWRIDLEARVATLIFDPSVSADTPVDAVALTLDSEADYLFFTDRRTGALFAYDL